MAERIFHRGRVGSAGALLVALAVVATVAAAIAASAAEAGTGAEVKRYAYTVQMTYSLVRDASDPATGLATTVERRLEAELRVWAIVSEDQVYTGTKGDYAEVDGEAVASVGDASSSSSCTQVAEAKGRVGLKFVTSRAPLTAVYISWNPGTIQRLPALPCGASEFAQSETGTRGTGDWSRVSGSSFWHESRTRFAGDVYANLAAGRNATFEVALPSPDATQRASVKLVFTRAADLEPKQSPSGKAVAVTKPVIRGIGRYNAAVWFAVTQGGQPVRISDASCTGSFEGGPQVNGRNSGYHLPRANALLLKLWPELKRSTGWVTLAVCAFEHEEYTRACGKTFRGRLRLVVGGKTIVKPVSLRWKAKEPCS